MAIMACCHFPGKTALCVCVGDAQQHTCNIRVLAAIRIFLLYLIGFFACMKLKVGKV